MRNFKHLPRDQEYRCRECSKTDFGNYFVSPTLCKKCAANRRIPTARPAPTVIAPEPGRPAITNHVYKRFKNQAENESINQHPEFTVPYSKLQGLVYSDFFKAMLLGPFCTTVLLVSLWFPGPPFFPLVWAALIGGGLKFYSILANQRKKLMAEPLQRWNEQVEERIGQLAVERSWRIDDRESFYQSAEWKAARRDVIARQGPICRGCQKSIVDDSNLTVDHIKPRSKYPSLQLAISNLEVLCRSCNSRKGNRELGPLN